MSRNLRVYKQSELASRDTTKSFFGPLGLSLRKNTGGGGMGSPSPSPGSATDKYLWAMTSSTNEFHFKQTG